MDLQEWILNQLSREVRSLLSAAKGADDGELDEVALHVAERTWKALLYYLRSSLIRSPRVALEEIGELRYDPESSSWSFEPAASLAMAVRLDETISIEDRDQYLGVRAAFHTTEALNVLDLLATDLLAHSREEDGKLWLSQRMLMASRRIEQAALRLAAERLERQSGSGGGPLPRPLKRAPSAESTSRKAPRGGSKAAEADQ